MVIKSEILKRYEYSTNQKIDFSSIKMIGFLKQDLFSNFIFFVGKRLKKFPKGYAVYWQNTCIYLFCVEKKIVLNCMWFDINEVDLDTGKIQFYGGNFTKSPSEIKACELFETVMVQIIQQILAYYGENNIRYSY